MLAEAGRVIGRFLRWWGGELRACLPAGVAATLFGVRDALEIGLGETEISLSRSGGGKIGTVTLAGRDTAEALAEARALIERQPSGRGVTLRLPHSRVLGDVVELPVAAAMNLREALAFEMDTRTPFRADEVMFDFAVAGGDAELERIRVELFLARREDIEDALACAAALGVTPDRITGPAEEEPEGTRINLLPVELRPRADPLVPRLTAALAALAVLLGAAALFVWFERHEAESRLISARLAQLRTEAAAVADLRARAERLTEISGLPAARKNSEPSMVALLDDLSQRLPDDHWLVSLTVSGGTVTLSGYSADPAEMLNRLERSPLLSGARFTSPLTMDTGLGAERFTLVANLTAQAEQP